MNARNPAGDEDLGRPDGNGNLDDRNSVNSPKPVDIRVDRKVLIDSAKIPSGDARLSALIDNRCLEEKLTRLGGLKGLKGMLAKGQTLDLSARAITESESVAVEGLNYQAYAFSIPDASSLSSFVSQAESDNCVLRVTDDNLLQAIPYPEALRKVDLDTRSTQKSEGELAQLMKATDDPGLVHQKHLTNIRAIEGWDVFHSATRGIRKNVVVAVVDSGVDYTHEDLQANMWIGPQGRMGLDLHNDDDDPMDDHGHGTHVSGLIGAVSNNGVGVSGVIGKSVKLMAVKVTNADGAAFPSDVSNGIRWAAENGAQVINLSLGVDGANVAVRDAVSYAISLGAVVVAAAGNDNTMLSTNTFVTPASYARDFPGLISVGAIDSVTNSRSQFSNYSPTYVLIAAPGSNGVISTYPDNGYATLEGTSMATPIVSGAAALTVGILTSEGINPSPTLVRNLILASARQSQSLTSFFFNGGSLDLERLGTMVKLRYLVESDGGTQNPF